MAVRYSNTHEQEKCAVIRKVQVRKCLFGNRSRGYFGLVRLLGISTQHLFRLVEWTT